MEELEKLLKEIEMKSKHFDVMNAQVSKSTVGWHIEHILLSINLIIKAMERSDPKEYKPKYSLAKLYVFGLKRIPRGRAKAPEIVRPSEGYNEATLKLHLEETFIALKKLSTLNKNHHFVHPYFGKINLKPAIKFLKIHTKHHLEIINDILV